MKCKSIFSSFRRMSAVILAALLLTGAFPSTALQGKETTDLTMNDAQAAPVAALGFSTDQPERYSPGGEPVDRAKSPFGVNKLTKYHVNQLLVNTTSESKLYTTLNDIGGGYKNTVSPVSGMRTGQAVSGATERVSVAADTDGDGIDETIGVYWVPSGPLSGKVSISITQYTSTKLDSGKYDTKTSTKTYAQAGSNTGMFSGAAGKDYERKIYAVSGDFDHDGKEEVAIGRGTTIAFCRITTSGITLLSTMELDRTDSKFFSLIRKHIINTGFMTLQVNGMLAADLDQDGFAELFVTAGSRDIVQSNDDTDIEDYERGTHSYLMIYRGTTDATRLDSPAVDLAANAGESLVYFDKPAMDMGNIFNDGEKELVIGGRLWGRKDDNNVGLTALHYDPNSDTYQTGLKDNRLYTFVSKEFGAVQNTLGIKCVDFNPMANQGQYVVLGGFIYKYNSENDAFDKQAIHFTLPDLSVNGDSKSKSSLTNVNYKKDKTYILDMLSANFDGRTLQEMGADTSEQLVVLHHNDWYDSRRIYVTTVSMKDGELYAYMNQLVNDRDNTYYMSLCAPDIYNRGLQMEFLPGQSEFVFSDPVVLAVLAATPYYSELEDEYEALGNAKTLFGTEKSKSSSQSHGLSVSASFLFGYDGEVGVFGQKITQGGWEAEISNTFTATFEKSKTIKKHVLYENYYNQNAVVVSSVPYDCYYFKITNTETGKSENTMVAIPFSPVTRIMSFSSYNKVVTGGISVIPKVDGVFSHKVGDPRTYPTSTASLSNVSGAKVQLGRSGDDYGSFVGVGIGNNVTEEGISISEGQSRSFENNLEVKFTFKLGAGGFYAGGSAGLGYTYTGTRSAEETEMYSGSVPGLPEGREAYSYKWSLVAYPYDLTVGSNTQRCMVVGYLCQPVGANYPPAPVNNFRVDSKTAASTVLKWNPPVTAGVDPRGLPTGYTLYRSDTAEGEYSQIADITDKNIVSYTDITAKGNSTCYYKLAARNTRESIPLLLEAKSMKIRGMKLKTPPKLSYTDDSPLDLSNLAVTLTYEDSSKRDVTYDDFGNSFSVSIPAGTKLKPALTGTSLTVTYIPGGIDVNVGTLTVAATNNDIGLTAAFTVGTTANAAKLEAGKSVSATATLRNNTAAVQPVIVVFTLYSDKGTTVASGNQAVTVAANGTSTVSFTNTFAVPEGAAGYSAGLFVWDGTSLSSSKQILKSNVITLQ